MGLICVCVGEGGADISLKEARVLLDKHHYGLDKVPLCSRSPCLLHVAMRLHPIHAHNLVLSSCIQSVSSETLSKDDCLQGS